MSGMGHSVENDASLTALIDKYDRLADNESARYCRAQDVAADLRDLRERIAAVVERMRTREVDHRHENEVGHWGVRGRAYFYAGDIFDDYEDLGSALGTRVTSPAEGDA